MGRVANVMDMAVLLHRLIVRFPEAGELGEQMHGEPAERLAIAYPALGDLKRLRPP